MVIYKIIIKLALIFSFLAFFSAQSCYLFCLFRPENRFEEIFEQFVEDEIEALSENPSNPAKKPFAGS